MPRPKFAKGNKLGKGGPVGNTKARRHGVASFLATGSLPAGCSYVTRQLGGLRRELERLVGESDGEIKPVKGAMIQSVIRHESRAVLLQRWLRLEGDKLGVLERASLLAQITAATTERDRLLARLLGSTGSTKGALESAWDDIYQDGSPEVGSLDEQGIHQDAPTTSDDQESQSGAPSAVEAYRRPEVEGASDD